MKSKVIAWKIPTGGYSPRQDKIVDYSVQNLHIDYFSGVIHVVMQKGNRVDQFDITMEYAQEIGFINFDSLKPYCK